MTVKTMRAWRIHSYGGPDALQLDSMPLPAPKAGEVLVRVTAISVNPIDWKMREGMLKGVFAMSFPRVLGRDCVGTVVESTDPALAVGARVLCAADPAKDGTNSEYALMPEAQTALVPDPVSDADAACLGVSGVSAWIPLMEDANIQAGQRVLIHAGAGGVGHIAIQLARLRGAEIYATCSASNADYVRSLGAVRTIDYRTEDFVALTPPCDAVLDVMGGETNRRSYSVLKPGGVLVRLSAAPVDPTPPRDDVRTVFSRIGCTRARLEALLALAVDGKLVPLVGKSVSFADLPSAYAASQTGHVRGKIIVTVP